MLIKDTVGRYISIKADGKFHETVTKETEGAVYREYETSSGEKGSKWELVYQKVEALITDIKFETGEYGENLQITLTDGDEVVTLSENTSSSFGEDLLKKLPSINFSQKVLLAPYAFENEKGKTLKGVQVSQQSDKIMNFFWDAENKESLHGFPVPEGDTDLYSKDDWKIHFLLVRKFLVSYAKTKIVPQFPIEISEDSIDEIFNKDVELEPLSEMDFTPREENSY